MGAPREATEVAAAGLEVGLGVEEEVTVEVGAGGWAD